MTEEQAQAIAEHYVTQQAIDKCAVVSIRRIRNAEIKDRLAIGDEWCVQFRFDDDDEVSSSYALVIVDDATAEPRFFDCL